MNENGKGNSQFTTKIHLAIDEPMILNEIVHVDCVYVSRLPIAHDNRIHTPNAEHQTSNMHTFLIFRFIV